MLILADCFQASPKQFEWPRGMPSLDGVHRDAAELGCVDAGIWLAVKTLEEITQEPPAWNDTTYNLYIRCLEVGAPHDMYLMDKLREMLTFPLPSGEAPEAREIRMKRASELEKMVEVAKKKDFNWDASRYYDVQWENGRAEHEENIRRYLPAAAIAAPAAAAAAVTAPAA